MAIEPRRTGTVEEVQHGDYLFYLTRWHGMTHLEVEIWKNEARMLWRSTDPNKVGPARDLFEKNPKIFEGYSIFGELPEGAAP